MNQIEELKSDLYALGVKKGDTLLVRADLGKIGKISTKKKEDYINFILDFIGHEGTLIGLSFTKSFFIKKNEKLIFDRYTKSYTGSFANLMLKHPASFRSSHPTNSVVAIGKNAHYVTSNHNECSGAYDPIKKIIELNGKMILIGCSKNSPGFTTVHFAEVELNLHKKIIFPNLNQVFYKKNDEIHLFKRKDIGSCSSVFHRFYGYYIQEECLFQGYIGKAYSLMINAKDAYKIDKKLLIENSKITICNKKDCKLCRVRRWDNLKDMPFFIIRKLLKKVRRLFD